jgi:phage gp36-like protein
MFWNKKLYDMHVVDTSLQDISAQMDEIDRVYKNPENACESMTIERFSRDAESYRIIESYYVKAKQLSRFTKDVRDLRAVVEGNGEYWASYQRNYKECQQRLVNAELHLKLEKEMYQKLYERNRELETKLYMTERELEILKGEVK